MSVQTQSPGKVNDVKVDQLVETVEAVQSDPTLGRFSFRAQTEWKGGGKSRTTIQDFYGAGQEDGSRTEPFVLEGDEPPVLLGENSAPNAVETVLHALSSCLAVGLSYNAAAQGIEIDTMRFELEGDLDLQGFLGLSKDVRPGYNNVRVRCRIESAAPRDKVEELLDYVKQTSPVFDILANPVPVQVQLT